jgi:hypothetical protein
MYLDGIYPLVSILVGQMYLEMYPFLIDFLVYLNKGFENIP